MADKSAVRWLRNAVITLCVLGVCAGIGGAVFIYGGVYNISALTQHTVPIFSLLEYTRVRSVAKRSESVNVPNLDDHDWRRSGMFIYEQHCEQCHGGPGVAPEPFALGMNPPPSAIVKVGRKRSPAELYWVVKHGIKMSGMPAWDYRLKEHQLWDLVATLKKLPELDKATYLSLKQTVNTEGVPARTHARQKPAQPRSDREWIRRGRIALQQYNCSSCHDIAGVTAATNHVGPPITHITRRSFIAGLLPMTDENLAYWIRFPDKVDPKTTMPDLGVTALHAEQMVAYLHSISKDPPPRSYSANRAGEGIKSGPAAEPPGPDQE